VTIPDAAAQGFGKGAADYEKGRPSYPPEAVTSIVDELGLAPGTTVVDLGAGTGKFTRLLLPSGARVVAVEPVASMREQFAVAVPEVEVVDGTAEAVPLGDGEADAVVVAQAAHWFDLDVALAEIARVLRPGGGLALLWNERDASEPWVADLVEAIRWRTRSIPRYEEQERDWPAEVGATGRFTPLEIRRFPYDHPMDEDSLVTRELSTSYIASLPEDEKAEYAERVRGVVAGFPPTFAMPYRTVVYTCRRR
jgi:SAM-dependent methyltransferase